MTELQKLRIALYEMSYWVGFDRVKLRALAQGMRALNHLIADRVWEPRRP